MPQRFTIFEGFFTNGGMLNLNGIRVFLMTLSKWHFSETNNTVKFLIVYKSYSIIIMRFMSP